MSRILLISHIFPPAIDGGSRVIYKLGQYLESQNHQTLYLSSDCSSTDDFTKKHYQRSRALANQSTIKLPVYHHLRRPLKFINLFLSKKPARPTGGSYLSGLLNVFQKGPVFKIIPFIKATQKIIKFKPELIIGGPLPTTTILYANFLKFLSRVLANQSTKLLINASFHPTDSDFHQKPLIKTLQQADYLWTLTQFETDYFIKNFHIDPQKIILAGNGIDELFLKKSTQIQRTSKPARQRAKILFIGSFSAHKGLDTLINSFSQLLSSQPEYQRTIKLIMAGQKTLYFPEIQKTIKKLPIKVRQQIKFIYNFPQKQLKKLIDSCDVLVLPSHQESFGLVLIESWARGKPVITSNIPALSEIVSRSNGGLIFDPKNASDLTQKIMTLINDPKLAHQLGQNGFNYVKNNYTWPIVGKKICQKNCLSLLH